eukprot:4861760-Amphidinium_carterae.1
MVCFKARSVNDIRCAVAMAAESQPKEVGFACRIRDRGLGDCASGTMPKPLQGLHARAQLALRPAFHRDSSQEALTEFQCRLHKKPSTWPRSKHHSLGVV